MEKIVPSDEQVHSLYRGRCILCRQLGGEIHEIIPRSQTKEWDVWDNRVILCKYHHHWVHSKGALNCADTLREKQRGVLEAYYGRYFGEGIERIFTQLY